MSCLLGLFGIHPRSTFIPQNEDDLKKMGYFSSLVHPQYFPHNNIVIVADIPSKYHSDLRKAVKQHQDWIKEFGVTLELHFLDPAIIAPPLNLDIKIYFGALEEGKAGYSHAPYDDKASIYERRKRKTGFIKIDSSQFNRISFFLVVLHEIGHHLYCYGHSPNPEDVMDPSSYAKKLTFNDISTGRACYFQRRFDLGI